MDRRKRNTLDGSFKRLKIQQINDHIWLLNDHDDGTGYLITGSDRALVIDTMYGLENLKEAVRTLTDLPLMLVNTHGHFDHVGTLESLAERWDVPVYAHPMELPYLSGQASYPPADPLVGGGAMALLSPLFPRSPVDVSRWLKPLPTDGSVPGMPGWRWIHTPGHAPGHISLWRESDRMIIAGDAVVTTGQESAYEVMFQTPEIHGPPRYLTPDWEDAERSVAALAALEPELLLTGHGRPVRGQRMRRRLHELAENFRTIAVPEGRPYAQDPAKPGKAGNDAYR